MSPSEDVEVDTFAGMLAIPARPDVGDGRTIEETSDGEGGAVCSGDGHKSVYYSPELLPREDAEAEEEEGHLGEGNGHEIEHFGQPRELYLSARSCIGTFE